MTNNTYDARVASPLISAVQIESPPSHISGIVPSSTTLRAHIDRSLPSIKYDLQTKVTQIANQDMFIFG